MREILLICDAFTQVALDVEHFHRYPLNFLICIFEKQL